MADKKALAGNATLVAGTTTVSTAKAMPSLACDEVLIQNGDATISLNVGDASSQPFVVLAGNALSVRVQNLSQVWVKAASSTITLNYLVTTAN